MAEVEAQKEKKQLKRLPRGKMTTLIILLCVSLIVVASLGVSAYFLARNSRTVTVTFNTKVVDIDPVTLKWGEVPELPEIAQDGYVFLGWYTEDNVLMDASFFDSFDYLSDIVLHAAWEVVDAVTITYDAKGGQDVEPLTVPRGYTKSVAGQTEREGYYLLGWCYDEQCLNMYYPDEVTIEEDMLLYAKWLPKTLGEDVVGTVAYNTMGGVAMDAQQIQLGQTLSLAEPHREGHVFLGWYSDKDCTYSVDSDILLTQSCVLYAKWGEEPAQYTVSFVSPAGAPTVNSKVYRYDAFVGEKDFSAPDWADHQFKGFYVDAEFTTKAEFPYYIRSDYTYYLLYESTVDIKNTIRFVLWPGQSEERTYELGTTLVDWKPSRPGYLFDGWFADEDFSQPIDLDTTPSSDGLVIYANWMSESDFADDAIIYALREEDDETFVVVKQAKDRYAEAIVIPAKFGDYDVKKIADRAFYGNNHNTIIIGENVTVIGEEAFSDMNLLEAITLPANVKEIGASAFQGCDKLTTVTIEGRAAIMDKAFYNCAALTSVTGYNVKSIGKDAFRDCAQLETVDFSYLTELKENAFYGCSKLSSFTIANSAKLTAIPTDCFNDCQSLTTFTLPDTVETIYGGAFAYSGLKDFSTKNVNKVYSDSFEGVQFQTLHVGKKTSFKEPVLTHAAVFGEITVAEPDEENPRRYLAIDGSLYNADGTRLILFGGSETCHLSKNVTDISIVAFLCATELKNITVDPENPAYCSQDGVLYQGTTLICYPAGREEETYTVEAGTTSVNSAAFSSIAALHTVILPESVTSVSPSAFYRLPNLSRIVCPEGVVDKNIALAECPDEVEITADE